MNEVKKDESDLSVLLHAEQLIKKELKGFHLEIMIYPFGGIIDTTGCEECGTDDSLSELEVWNLKKGESIVTAVKKLKDKLGL